MLPQPATLAPSDALTFYRGYIPGAMDHFYTTSKPELGINNAVTNLGYTDEARGHCFQGIL